uniref:Peptidase S1 domain-containing protein n=1 Tax=Timema cristinae TaxID=61476 RepID=A0A7R9D3B9_TIMCR|nr:unnamed protein product [Timema cristinae]
MKSLIPDIPRCAHNDPQTYALERLHPPHIRVRQVTPSGTRIVEDRPEQLLVQRQTVPCRQGATPSIRILMSTEYSGELVTDGSENLDCGAGQAVERPKLGQGVLKSPVCLMCLEPRSSPQSSPLLRTPDGGGVFFQETNPAHPSGNQQTILAEDAKIICHYSLLCAQGPLVDVTSHQEVHGHEPPQRPRKGHAHLYPSRRISNGDVAEVGQFPWQVALSIDRHTACGASLISEEWVLTAAHCVYNKSNVTLLIGSRNRQKEDEGSLEMTSGEFIVHPKYSQGTNYDLGLIKLPTALALTDNIKPVDLPKMSQENETFVDRVATVSGWGRTTRQYTEMSRTDCGIQARLVERIAG